MARRLLGQLSWSPRIETGKGFVSTQWNCRDDRRLYFGTHDVMEVVIEMRVASAGGQLLGCCALMVIRFLNGA